MARPVKDAEAPTRRAGGKFDPSGCGGHKNSENAATFSELLGQEDKLSPAPGHNRQQPTARARAVFSYTRSAEGKRYGTNDRKDEGNYRPSRCGGGFMPSGLGGRKS